MKRWQRRAVIGGILLFAGCIIVFLSAFRSPGWVVAAFLFQFAFMLGVEPNARSLPWMIVLASVVDGALCFAIFWGGYSLWVRIRRKSHAKRTFG